MSIRLELEKELERKFREKAMHDFGYYKGSLLKAGRIAISKWVHEERPSKLKQKTSHDHVTPLVGLLKDVKHKSSVEEQHEIRKLWLKAAEDK